MEEIDGQIEKLRKLLTARKSLEDRERELKVAVDELEIELKEVKERLLSLMPTDTISLDDMTLMRKKDFKLGVTTVGDEWSVLKPDLKKIREAVKFGIEIPGVDVIETETLVIRKKL